MVPDASSAGTGPKAECWLWWRRGGQRGQALGVEPADSNHRCQRREGSSGLDSVYLFIPTLLAWECCLCEVPSNLDIFKCHPLRTAKNKSPD